MLKKRLWLVLIIFCVLGAGLVWLTRQQHAPLANKLNQTHIVINPMQITSSAFLDNQTIPLKYTCDGDGVSPPLEFKDVPEAALTLAVTMADPDVPSGSWTHWILWNITAFAKEIGENQVPAGAVVGKGSSGQNVYGGPCPPSGTHHYIFTLYALDSKLTIPSYSTLEELKKAMEGHVITKAELVGLYNRNK